MTTLNWIAFATVILNVVLNWIYIPQLGAQGAAMASFISLGFMALSQFVFCQKRYSTLSLSWISKAVLVWCATAGIATVIMILGIEDVFAFAITAVLSAVVFSLIAFDFQQLMETLKSKSAQ